MAPEHSGGEPVAADRSGIGFLLGYAARLTWRGLDDRLTGLGLDDSSYIVLVNVGIVEEREGRGPLVSEMVEQLALRPGYVDNAAGRLMRLGLLEAVPDGTSARLRLLERGRQMMPALLDEARWLLETSLSGFTYEEIDEFTAYLRRVVENLGGHTR